MVSRIQRREHAAHSGDKYVHLDGPLHVLLLHVACQGVVAAGQ